MNFLSRNATLRRAQGFRSSLAGSRQPSHDQESTEDQSQRCAKCDGRGTLIDIFYGAEAGTAINERICRSCGGTGTARKV